MLERCLEDVDLRRNGEQVAQFGLDGLVLRPVSVRRPRRVVGVQLVDPERVVVLGVNIEGEATGLRADLATDTFDEGEEIVPSAGKSDEFDDEGACGHGN